MYLHIDPTPFDMKLLNLPNDSRVPEFPEVKATNGSIVPYTRKQTLRIMAPSNARRTTMTQHATYIVLYMTLLNPPNEDSPIGGKDLPPAKYWPLVY